ncbi:hypothetical protein GCM10009603_45460 [Nocardiopsis exhalans]
MLPWVVRRTRLPLLVLPCVDCADLVAGVLLDPALAGRHGFALDWRGCWELHAPEAWEGPWPLDVWVTFEEPVPVRPEQLIAHGLGISRGEVLRRVKIDIGLKRRTMGDFCFVVV